MSISALVNIGMIIGVLAIHPVLPRERTSLPCTFANPTSLRLDSAAYAVVVATADTTEAGSRGAHSVALGAWDSLKERLFGSSVYGQTAKLTRYGGPWESRVGQSNQEVILVPWDLSGGGSCRPVPWKETHRWLTPDSTYLVIGVLRDPKYWKGNRPVIDIPPSHYVYPGAWYDVEYLDQVFVYLPGEDSATVNSSLMRADRSLLAPATLFSMYQDMPTYRDAETAPDSAEAVIQRWEVENPELLNNFVVLKMLRFAKAQVRATREYCELENC